MYVNFCVLKSACPAGSPKVPVLLHQKLDGGQTFDRTWNEFKNGFRDAAGNYWLGNDRIHMLTKDSGYRNSV